MFENVNLFLILFFSVCIEIERCDPKLFGGLDSRRTEFSKMLAAYVDIRWKIVSLFVTCPFYPPKSSIKTKIPQVFKIFSIYNYSHLKVAFSIKISLNHAVIT